MGEFQIHDDSATDAPEAVVRAKALAEMVPPTREEAEQVIRGMEALGLVKDDDWDAEVARHDNRTLMGLIKFAVIDAMRRMVDGDFEGFAISTYGVALLTVEAYNRGVLQ